MLDINRKLQKSIACWVIRLPGRPGGGGEGRVFGVCVCVLGVPEINEAELSIRSSSLSSFKPLFILLLSGLSGRGNFPQCILVRGDA